MCGKNQYGGCRRGLGDFMPAVFPVPENPFAGGSGANTGIGDFMPAYFPVPQNPLDRLNVINAPGAGGGRDCGCGCGGSGACGGGISGLGDISLPSLPSLSSLSTMEVGGIPVTYLAAGALALYLLLGRGTEYRDEARLLRAKYKSDLAQLKSDRPRRYVGVKRTLASYTS